MFEYNGKDDETAFDDELWCYEVGDDLNFLPRNAGVVCFTGPDRVAVKLTVKKISEKSISFIKEYDR